MPDPDAAIAAGIERKEYRRALEIMARTYAERLGRLCMAMVGNQAEAEELVQEILLAAYGAMPRFEGRSTVRTWLYRIARRSCSRATEKRNRRRVLLATGSAVLHPADDPPPWPGQRERLRQAMAELSEAQQEVLLLRYVSGLSFREVSEVCGIREEAARQRASVGLRQLRRKMAAPQNVTREPLLGEIQR